MDRWINGSSRPFRRSRSVFLLRKAAGACSGALPSRPGLEALEPRTLLTAGAVGPEFLVNTCTTESQSGAAIAMDSAGNFAIVWQSWSQDGDGVGVYARRYSDAGVPLSGEFRVNTYTTGDQERPAVAMNSAGDFVVAWESKDQDGLGRGVYAQRYSAAGVPQGAEFQVNTFTQADEILPAIAMDSAGDFVVTWYGVAQDGSAGGIYAQRYSASGVRQGNEFLVNTWTTDYQSYPAITMDAAGDFVIVWQSKGQDGDGWGIYGRRYTPAGAALGQEFRVNTSTTGDQTDPFIATDSAGDFVVAWSSPDGNGQGVCAQRYSAAGTPQGGEFRVNTYITTDQYCNAVAMDSAGDFVIPWQSALQDGNDWGVYAQRYSAAGLPQGGEFRVNTCTTGEQSFAAATMNSSGNFVIAWQSYGQDGSFYGVYARLYDATPPKAQLAFAPNVLSPGATIYDFTIVYSDNSQIDLASLGGSDILVTSARGFSASAQFISATPAGNGSPRTATYRLTPPGGTWDAADSGVYTIALQATEVADVGGNHAAAATLGSFKVDCALPAAKLKKLAKVKRGKSPFRFTVTYWDDLALDHTTIGPRDIYIAGPKGFRQYAKFKSKTLIAPNTCTAVYEIAPPKKKWDSSDNGSYTIWLNANHILDSMGKAAKKTRLGVLKVKC